MNRVLVRYITISFCFDGYQDSFNFLSSIFFFKDLYALGCLSAPLGFGYNPCLNDIPTREYVMNIFFNFKLMKQHFAGRNLNI